MSYTEESPLLRLELVEIDKFKRFVPFAAIVLCFAPIFLSNSMRIKLDAYLGYWVITCLLLFFCIKLFLSITSKSGYILFFTDKVHLNIKGRPIIIPIADIQKIEVKYKGFKGEDVQYSFPFFYSLKTKDGLGSIDIFVSSKTLTFHYVAKESTFKKLISLKKNYPSSLDVVVY